MKAFPHQTSIEEINGMDLRDYFAAKAMQAFLTETTHQGAQVLFDSVGNVAYLMADAMMEARNVKK